MIINIMLGLLGIIGTGYGFIFGGDVYKNRKDLEKSSIMTTGIIGFVANFFDTLGIGSFAIITASVKGLDQVRDKYIPGTLNVSCTIPIIFEAFIFMSVVKVEIITLVTMIIASVFGAYIGAGIVSHMDERKIQIAMGGALLTTAALMAASQLELLSVGGNAIGLTGTKLVIGIVGNFILGALMTAGIGLYAPCMALVYMLGMSPDVAFPIMMGSCAFLMPVASVKFIKEKAYNKKASAAITVFGIFGVLVAVLFFKGLNIYYLTWLVVAVLLYTGITLLKSAFTNMELQEAA